MRTQKQKKYDEKYRNSHKEETKKWKKENSIHVSEYNTEYQLKINYNLTLMEYNELLMKQNGVCAICLKPEIAKHQSGKIKKLAVDHNHETGKIRGLLCVNCNNGLGRFKDSALLTDRATKYLLNYE
jgi:iron-sulfur cluster repair protein YtfE (RIC family)